MASSIPNRGTELLVVDVVFMTAAVVANALRCFVRIYMVKAFGLDDWLMAIATSAFICYCSFSIAGVHHGTGRHHADLPLEGIQRATNNWWYCYLFYCVSMITSKLSIGWFLLRIAVKKIHSWIIYAAMFISVVAGMTFFFVTLFQCKPISYFWNKEQPGSCISIEVIIGLGYLYSTFSIISDFTFAIIPAFLVWNLQLKRRTKMALIPLLTMGCIASAAVVARVPFMKNFRSPDFLWATLDIAIWSTVEQGLAITAGSLATLRPLFSIVLAHLGLTSGPSRFHPSRYGPQSPSASHALNSRRKPSQDLLNRYNMSNITESAVVTEVDVVIDENEKGAEIPPPSPNWFTRSKRRSNALQQQMQRNKLKKEKEKENAARDNESQRSLHARSSQESFGGNGGGDGMHIMVSKSFIVTDENK